MKASEERRALDAGSAILARGGSAVDAVVAAVRVLEDDPYFNAGRGAVFSADGINELDAAIMDGANRAAGARQLMSPRALWPPGLTLCGDSPCHRPARGPSDGDERTCTSFCTSMTIRSRPISTGPW